MPTAAVMASLYGPEDLDALEGRVATTSIAKGSLVARDTVRSVRRRCCRSLDELPDPTCACVRRQALTSGHRVDILAVVVGTADAGYVMTGVEVLAVDGGRGGPLSTPEDVHAHHRGRSRRARCGLPLRSSRRA